MKLNTIITIDSLAPSIVAPKERQLLDAIANSGLESPSEIIFDGEIHRFSSNGKPQDKAGWYVAYSGDIAAAAFGCWRLDLYSTWRADIGRSLNYIEEMEFKRRMNEAKIKRDAENDQKHENAAQTAEQILIESNLASDNHEYLLLKGIKSHGARISNDGKLIIPVCSDGKNKVSSLQYISGNGEKKFLFGGAIAGCWWQLGDFSNTHHIYIAEGFATAASIHEATNKPVVIAFNAGNIPAVSRSVRSIVGNSCTITICADKDEHGIGEKKANEAAVTIGAKVIVSPVSSDFNDAAKQGIDIASILNPIVNTNFLQPLGEFCNKPAPIKWLVKHWLQRNSLCMVHGASGSGKTFVVIDWMCRIASTVDTWTNHQVHHGAVVYLAGEGHSGLKGRFEAWSRKHYNGDTSKINLFVSKEGCNLNTPEGYNKAREAIISLGIRPVCIVIDTLHRFLYGDENSAQDAKTMLDACADLQSEFETSVILVHHTGVSEEAQHRARGSSAWKGALDTEISVKQSANKTIEVSQKKNKDGELAEPKFLLLQGFALEGWNDEDGEIFNSATIIEGEKPIDLSTIKTPKSLIRFKSVMLEKGILKDNEPFLSEDLWSNSLPKDEKGHIPGNLKTQRAKDKKELKEMGIILEDGNGYLFINDVMRLDLNRKFNNEN